MELGIKGETFVFEVMLENGEDEMITLDSGAGVHVWPRDRGTHIPLETGTSGVTMWAANGTQIPNLGQKVVKFRGKEPFQRQSNK